MAKKKATRESNSSVKYYQQGIESEKHKMNEYSDKFKRSVKSKGFKEAASKLREDAIKTMTTKVNKFKGDIKDQIKENKEAVIKINSSIKHFLNQIENTKKDFRAYTKAFWG